jgi:hypothetical protein
VILCADSAKVMEQMQQVYSKFKNKSRPTQKRGVFYSQFTTISERKPVHKNAARATDRLQRLLPGRRLSSIQLRSQVIKDINPEASTFSTRAWDGFESHYNLAIYASGRAFVPDVVDNILCQVNNNYYHIIKCSNLEIELGNLSL